MELRLHERQEVFRWLFRLEKRRFADGTTGSGASSFLYSKPVEVPGVWSAISATAPGSYENSGHNNNLSFVITDAGVVVMNASDNYLLAQALHDEIKQRTDQPVKYVLLENGQGHAMLGTGYWQEQGAQVIVHQDAWHEMESRGPEILQTMRRRNRDKGFPHGIWPSRTSF
ncbi:MAG: hypothetical protein R3E95_16205 [Thiolinea sp.]